MDEDVIDDLAAGFLHRLTQTGRDTHYGTILEDIFIVACVIKAHNPTYDIRYFYQNSGFPHPYPEHEM